MTAENLPNLFLIGAAKSATTSLHAMLRQHPEVFFPEIKSPSYFCKDFQLVNTIDQYLELYKGAESFAFKGDASSQYLTCRNMPNLLKEIFPGAKIVVILRNPTERAYSAYNHMCRSGYEYAGSFEKALELENERFYSGDFRRKCSSGDLRSYSYFYNYLYYRSGEYAEYLEPYIGAFGKENIKILKYEDFVKDSFGTISKLFVELGIEPSKSIHVKVKNKGEYRPAYPLLQWFVSTKMWWAPRVARKYVKSYVLEKMNKDIPPMKISTRHRLNELYRDPNNKLERLTGIAFDW